MVRVIRKFLDFCQEKERKELYLSIVITVIQTAFEMMKMGAIYLFIRAYLDGTMSMKTCYMCLGIMIISIIGAGLIKNKATILQTEGGYRTCAKKRMQIAEHLRYVPMGYFNENSLGETLSVTTNTMEQLEGLATRVIMMVSSAILSVLVITVMILIFDYRIGLILIIGLIIFSICNSYLQKKSSIVAPEKMKSDAEVVSQIMEYLDGITEVKTYKLTGDKTKHLNDVNKANAKINIKLEKTFTPIMGLQVILIKLINVAIVFASIYFFINGTMSLADSLMMIIASFVVNANLESASGYSALIRIIDQAVDKGNNILKSKQMNLEGSKEKLKNLDIVAKDIEFSYSTKKIIDGVSFTIPEKTVTAIVGPSGGGKSTITKLIARFFDVDKGSITIGGRDIKDFDYDSLMKNFSFVFQNVYLFKDTILNNIRFGKPEASLEEVIEVAKKARCHDFIMSLEKGYDTVIGEGGINLSGGEKQRISIARAMMKDSPIIILDEATANVDPENEKDLMAAIAELTKNKTIIMIAHRLKTVKNADQILVVVNGKISERGTHEELIKTNSVYKEFISGREKAVSWKIS